MKYYLGLVCIITSLLAFNSNADRYGAESFTLENGMQVVVIPNTKVPAVSHMVWYKTGSQDEPLGKSGIAHFLEHLMFKGTKDVGPGELSKRVARAGGTENAFTGQDFTAYFQSISRDKLELVMYLEADRMQNLVFDEKEVLLERDVILEERSAQIDNKPLSRLKEQMKAALYLNHPYGRPLIGWRYEIENLSLEDAKSWYEKHYSPNNAILIVSGDITVKELKPLAEKYYGKIKIKNIPAWHTAKEPEHIAPININLSDKNATKSEWLRYYLAPSQTTSLKEHSYALTLLSYVFGESNTSRLHQTLVVNDRVAVSVGSYYSDLTRGKSMFVVYGMPAEGKTPDDVQNAINVEINKIKNYGITLEELKRAKKAMISEAIYSREDLRALAYTYGQALTTGVGLEYVDTWETRIKEVTLDDIKAAANVVFNPDNSVTGRLLKEGGENE